MKNYSKLKTVNELVFTPLVLLGVITSFLSLTGLDQAPQSRIEYSLGSFYTVMTCLMTSLSVALGIGWKRIFPLTFRLL